jgi:hypothetical protein
MDIKEAVLAAFTFVSSNIVRGAANEKGKQWVERKPDEKEELITKKDINNFLESICFVIFMGLYGYISSSIFTEINSQKFTSVITASTVAISIVKVSPRRIIDKQENNS